MKNSVELYRCDDEIVNDAFDRTVVNIYLQKEKNNNKSFMLCGTEAGVGTTSISVELSISLSVAGWKVLLIDGDLRKDKKYKRLNDNIRKGLSDYIVEDLVLSNIINQTNWNGLDYISCGVSEKESPVRLLCSTKMEDFFDTLKKQYDFIIIDTPSLNSAVDAKILAAKVDAVALVTALHRSARRSLDDAKRQIQEANGNLIGIIQNHVKMDEYKRYIKDFDYFKNKKYVSRV